MKARPARAQVRETATQAQPSQHYHAFPAMVRGWVVSEPLATGAPGGATVMENWRPTMRGARVRGGSGRKASLNAAILSMFTYETGSTKQMYAATADSIFRVDNPASATVPPAAAVTGKTSGDWSAVLFNNAGGTYLVAVNGADAKLQYDGAAWGAGPAITGVASTALNHVWVFKSRLFFVEKNSLNAWYLPVDSIGGAASQVSLSGVFQKGGKLLFGGSFSFDTGGGMSEMCVFVSDKGECAVYQGSNPSVAADWLKVGLYDIGAPMGKRASERLGGDLAVMTEKGFIRLSDALKQDTAVLATVAVSSKIDKVWRAEALARKTGAGWSCVKWDNNGIGMVGIPALGDSPARCFVVNLITGAWAEYIGWNIAMFCLFDGHAYFGTPLGRVMIAESSDGNDDGSNYYAKFIGLYEHLGAPGPVKAARLARGTFLASQSFIARLGVSTDYTEKIGAWPDAAASVPLEGWDVGLWDVAHWDANSPVARVSTRWVSVDGTGATVAPVVQITCGASVAPDVELVLFELLYEEGAIAV